eukprot:TRINITY_DN24054_c0_g1_i1.p1 TRINITY_DN24054_c0_g1~~TRINITY_DN24054_c0_g1_i1.p1  ORF type:complete len:547 (+),score=62.73 TRINITY_DN24054_c0_g1_i1:211-1851(+)
MKDVLDLQALSVSGRFSNATFGLSGMLPNRTRFGMADLFKAWQVPAISQVLGKSERVGVRMAREGFTVKHPVIMIPGIITTGLEVWDGEACIKSYFRQRIWGTTTMFQSLMRDPDCWVRHLSLNSTTGLDPLQRPHLNRSIRVRPSQGFESADFFLGGYWLWGLMIEALADIGYDQNSMHMASYDWRLAFSDMELRDRYFTRLRQQIETLVGMSGTKALVVAHSMGGNVWHYFMQWVTHRVHVNWVHDHISSVALVSSPLLGLPKAYYSLLTGDNRDFANMGTFSAVVDHFFGIMTRRSLWRSCSSLSMIMPMGGDSVWGEDVTGMPLVQLHGRNLTVEEAYSLFTAEGSLPADLQRIKRWLLEGLHLCRPPDADLSEVEKEPPEHSWANPLAVMLPFAPKLRMYALYGVGVTTEYTGAIAETGDDAYRPRYSIDKDAFSPNSGFVLGDGDYSCPVPSLGLMCHKGWRDEKRNPARIPCTVKEYRDKKSTLMAGGTIRGGPASGDHVDILGNDELLGDILRLASGSSIDSRITSDLEAIAARWNDV